MALLNANTAGGFQSGEASLVGVDSDGAVAPSTDGSFSGMARSKGSS